MKVLDLFSGIGGFSLGLHRAGMETVAFCEIELYPQAVLRKNFPGVPIYDDVRTVTAERLRADGIDRIDLVCGGFPCQPFSVAGKQQGKDDHRHLWPEMLRIVQEFQPAWVIGENVAGFVEMALDDVSADLENAGYEVQSFVIPACAADAPHRRDRCWIVAHARRERIHERRQFADAERENYRPAGMGRYGVSEGCFCKGETLADTASKQNDAERGNCECRRDTVGREHQTALCNNGQTDNNCSCGCSEDVSDTNGTGREKLHTATVTARQGQHTRATSEGWSHWTVEPAVGRVVNGLPNRVERIKCLGNAVVPAQAREAFMRLINLSTPDLWITI
jgi:DNA (cytosine-5)-methyltransferase 1